MKTVYLSVISWNEMIDKRFTLPMEHDHLYATLNFGSKSIQLMYNINSKEAKLLSDDYKYHEGRSSKRFLDKDKLIDTAIKQYREIFPEADILVKGEEHDCFPPIVLHCSSGYTEYKEIINTLHDKWELNGGWNNQNKEDMDKIINDYMKETRE